MHLSYVSGIRNPEATRPTHELSEMEMTRGARSDDLFMEPLEPLDVGEDKPWMPLSISITAWKTISTHIHAIALHGFDGRSLGSRR